MKQIIILFSLLLLSACATSERIPAAKDKSKIIPVCAPKTLQSGDAELYWQIAAGQPNLPRLEDICQIALKDIRPTQFAVGMQEVARKTKNISSMSKKNLEFYLQENPEPVVIGPKGEFFIIDHHHLARALYEAKVTSTYAIVLESWFGTSEELFWERMKSKNWVYLMDEKGAKRTIADLTTVQKIQDLKDDPFRSLAGQTRCKVEAKCAEGQWLKQPIPFIEFLWAEHFRRTPAIVKALELYGQSDFSKVTDEASLEVKRLKGVLPENESHF